MILESTAAAFEDFGGPATLRAADASASFATVAVYDEATIEHQTEQGAMTSRQPQVTVPLAGSAAYGEGDLIDIAATHGDPRCAGKTFEILDANSDNAVTTYNVSLKP